MEKLVEKLSKTTDEEYKLFYDLLSVVQPENVNSHLLARLNKKFRNVENQCVYVSRGRQCKQEKLKDKQFCSAHLPPPIYRCHAPTCRMKIKKEETYCKFHSVQEKKEDCDYLSLFGRTRNKHKLYLKLAKELHPDKGGKEEEYIKMVNAYKAFDV